MAVEIPTVSGFLHALGYKAPLGDLELRALPLKRGDATPARSFWPNKHDDLGPLHALNADGYGVFFGVAHREGGGKASNVTRAYGLWVDLDGHDFDDDFDEGRAKAVSVFEERLPKHLQPSAVVDSGGGYHGYWFFDEPSDLSTPAARIQFESILRGVATHLGGDLNCCDVPRVLRLPGFRNTKYKNAPLVRIVYFDPNKTFTEEMITEFIDPVQKIQREIKPSQPATGPRVIGEGGRHGFLLKWAGRLARGGAKKESVLAFLRSENEIVCDPPKEDDLVVFLANDTSRRFTADDPVQRPEGSFADQIARGSAIAAMDIKPPAWLVDKLFLDRGFHLVAGPPNSYKSWLTMAALIAVTNGKPLTPTHTVTVPGSALFIGAEGGDQLLRRAQLLAAGFRMPLKDEFQVHSKSPNLGTDERREEVKLYVEEHQIDALVLDPARFLFDLQTDKQDGWTPVIKWLRAMAEICCVILVHHTRKLPAGVAEELSMDSISGPGSLIAAADMIWMTRRNADTSTFELINPKSRDEALSPTVAFHFDAHPDAFSLSLTAPSKANPDSHAVLEYLRKHGRCNKKQLGEGTKLWTGKLIKAIDALEKDDLIDSVSDDNGNKIRYFLPEERA